METGKHSQTDYVVLSKELEKKFNIQPLLTTKYSSENDSYY